MKKYSFLFVCLCYLIIAKAQFSIFNTGNSGLNDNNCWFINVNTAGDVWVGTNTGGANVLNGSAWTHYNTSNSSLQSNYITPVFFDATGNTWLGSYTGTGGLAKYNGSAWTIYTSTNSGLAGNDIMSIAADVSGNLWIATRFNGVSMFNGATWTVFNTGNSALPDNQIYSIETDHAGNVWVGTALYGLWKYSGGNWTSYLTSNSGIPDNTIYSLKYNTVSNTLWVGTYNGLGILDPVNNTWTIYNSANSGIAGDYIRGISFSPLTGAAWIATGSSGISKFLASTWTTYNTTTSNLPTNAIWAIKAAANGVVWASTWGAGVVSFKDQVTPTSIATQQPAQEAGFNLFPNPNNGSFTVNNSSFKSVDLSVVNLMGQVVYRQTIHPGNNLISTTIIKAGIYSYIISQNADHISTGKFIIAD
jgi:ligand-binding sensor domain-containing protein